ncbi:TPA: YadA-like family protein [Mannheimia haemolytica]
MNKTFRVIWSHVQQALVVVSELTKTQGKAHSQTNKQTNPLIKYASLTTAAFAVFFAINPTELLAATYWSMQGSKGNDGADTGSKQVVHDTSVVIGKGATAVKELPNNKDNPEIVVIGGSAKGVSGSQGSNGSKIVVVGFGAQAAESGIAIGWRANAGNEALGLALGREAVASKWGSSAIGWNATAQASFAQSFGEQAKAEGDYSVSIGQGAYTKEHSSVALGRISQATAIGSAALGTEAKAFGPYSVALGAQAKSDKLHSTALGPVALANEEKATAVGRDATASHKRSVALGDSAATAGVVKTTSATVNGVSYSGFEGSGNEVIGTVSIGRNGETTAWGNADGSGAGAAKEKRTITNVAAGRILKDSTDAINGSQLYIVAHNLANGWELKGNGAKVGDVKIGQSNSVNFVGSGNTCVTTSGSNGNYTVTISSTASTAAATGNLKFQDGNSGVITKNLNESLRIKGTGNGAENTYSGDNLQTFVNNGELVIKMKDAPTFNGTITANKGITMGKDQPINMNGGKITNLADPTANTDAANKQYVDSRTLNVGASANGQGANVSLNQTTPRVDIVGQNNVTTSVSGRNINVDLTQDTKTAIQKGVDAKTAVDTKALTILDSGAGKIVRKLGEEFRIRGEGDAIGDNSIYSGANIRTFESSGSDLIIKMRKDPNFTNVTTTDGFYVTNGPTVNTTGINAGNKAITNVGTPTNASDAATKQYVDNGRTKVISSDKSVTVTNTTDTKTGQVTYDVKVASKNGLQAIQVGSAPDSNTVAVDGANNRVNVVGKENVTTSVDGRNINVELTQNTKNDIKQGVDANATVNNKGITFNADKGNTNATKLGESVAIKGSDNIETSAENGTVTVKLKNDVNLTDKGNLNFGGNGNAVLNKDGLTIGSGDKQVSVTKNGINAGNNVVSNVSDGVISSTSKEAVNGSQLYATNQNVTNISNEVAKGWNLTHAQAEGGNATGTTNEKIAMGDTVTIEAAKNIKITQSNKKMSISTVDNPSFTSANVSNQLTLGNGATTTNLTSTANGLDVGGDRITNVGTPVAENDVTTKKYVDDGRTEVVSGDNSVTVTNSTNKQGAKVFDVRVSGRNGLQTLTVGADEAGKAQGVNINGTDNRVDIVGKNNITTSVDGRKVNVDLTEQTKKDIKQGVDANNTVTNKGITFNADNGNTNATKLGENVTIKGSDNIETSAENSNVTVKLKNNVNLTDKGNVTFGNDNNAVLNKDGLTIGAPGNSQVFITSNGISAGNKVISNVADGKIASDSKEAVNGSQLHATNQNVTNLATEVEKGWLITHSNTTDGISSGEVNQKVAMGETVDLEAAKNIKIVQAGKKLSISTIDNPNFTTVTASQGFMVTNGPSMTTNGINAGNKVITNVGTPVSENDATTKKYVDDGRTIVKSTDKSVDIKETAENGAKVYDLKVTPAVNTGLDKFTIGANASQNGIEVNRTNNRVDVVGNDGLESKVNGNTVEITLNQTTKDNIQKGVDANTTVNEKGITFTADKGNTNITKLGDSVGIKGGNNIETSAKNGDVTVNLKNNVDLTDKGNVAFGGKDNTELNKDGLTIGTAGNSQVSVTKDGISAGSKTITNLANGTNATDAVSLQQLNATRTVVKSNQIKTTAATPVDNTNPNAPISITSMPNATNGGTDFTVNLITTDFNATNGAITKPENSANRLATASAIADAINSAGWFVNTSTSGSGSQTGKAEKTIVQPSNEVTLLAGDNLVVNQNTRNITYSLNPVLKNITSIAMAPNGNIDMNSGRISNLGAPQNPNDATTKQYVDDGRTAVTSKDGSVTIQSTTTNGKTTYDMKVVPAERGLDSFTIGANSTEAGVEVNRKNNRVDVVGNGNISTSVDGRNINVDLTKNTKDDIKKGVDAKDIVDNKGITFASNNGSTSATKLGETVKIVGDNNIKTSASGDILTVELNPNVNLTNKGNVTFGEKDNAELNKDGLSIGNEDNKVSVTRDGIVAGNKQITNVASGLNGTKISEATDSALKNAVNVGDLKAMKWELKSAQDGEPDDANKADVHADDVVTVNGVGAVNVTHKARTVNIAVTTGDMIQSNGKLTYAPTTDGSEPNNNALTTVGTVVSAVNSGFWKVSDSKGSSDEINFGDEIVFSDTGNVKATVKKEGEKTQISLNADIPDIVTSNLSVSNGSGKDGNTDKKGNLNAPTNSEGFVKAGDLVNTLNNVSFNVANMTTGDGSSVKAGDTIRYLAGDNMSVTADGNNFTFALKPNVNLSEAGNVTFGGSTNAVLNKDGLTIGEGDSKVAITKDGINAGNKTINNVAPAELSDSSKQAVNGSQLYATNQKVAQGWNITHSQGVGGEASGDENQNVQLGETVTIEAAKNIKVVQSGRKLAISTVENPIFTTVTATDKITIGKDGNTTNLTSTVNGLDVGDDKITNLSSGLNGKSLKEAKDQTLKNAVNVGDLQNAINNVSFVVGADSSAKKDGVNLSNEQNRVDIVGKNGLETNVSGNTIEVTLTKETQDNIQKGVDANTTVTNKGITFNGDKGSTNATKLGESVEIKGSNNIETSAENSSVTVKLKNNVNLTEAGNVTFGSNTNAVLNKDGLTIGEGDSKVAVTKDGIVAGNKQVTGVASGLTKDGNIVELANAEGNMLTNGVNVGDLKTAINNVNNAANGGGFILKDTSGSEVKQDLGKAIKINGKDGVQVEADAPNKALNVSLAGDVSVNGKDGKDGSITVKDKNGKNGVSIQPNAIVFNGVDGVKGKDGKDSTASLAFVKGDKGLDGNDGNDGVSKTRIEYIKPNGDKEQVATLKDGLIFGGNSGLHNAALNSRVNIQGKVSNTDWNQFDAGRNIMTRMENGNLTVALANDINANSVTSGNTVLDKNGLQFVKNSVDPQGKPTKETVGPQIRETGISAGNTQITNVSSGLGNKLLSEAKGDTLTNAVNVGDLQNVSNSITNANNGGGFGVSDQNGKELKQNLGSTVAVKGDGNIATEVKTDKDGKQHLEVQLNKDISGMNSAQFDAKDANGNVTHKTNVTGSGITISSTDPNKGSVVSLNYDGLNNGGNKITNVAAGDAPTDAVNVSQLKNAQSNAVAGATWQLTTEGDNSTHAVSNQTVNVKHGINTKVSAVTERKDKQGVTHYEYEIDVTGIPMEYVDNQGNSLVNVGGNFYRQEKGENGQLILTPSTPAKVKLSSSKPMQLSNVDKGTAETDAVNVSQLKQVAENLGGDIDNSGNLVKPNYVLQDPATGVTTQVNNVKQAVGELNRNVNKPLSFVADKGQHQARLGTQFGIRGDDKNITTEIKGGAVRIALNDNIQINSAQFGATNGPNTKVNSKGVQISDGDRNVGLTINGLNNGGNRITGVKAGEKPTDAVNVAQLRGAVTNVANNINKVDRHARAGIASAGALANLPQVYLPGKSAVSVGSTYYRGEAAYAIGYSRISDNGKWIIKATGSTNTQRDTMVGAGASYIW